MTALRRIRSATASLWLARSAGVKVFLDRSGTGIYRYVETGVLIVLLAVLALVVEEQVVAGLVIMATGTMLKVTREQARLGIVLAIASVCTCVVIALFWPPGVSNLGFSVRPHPIRGVVTVGARFLGDRAVLHLPFAPYDVRTDREGRFEFAPKEAAPESFNLEVEYDRQRYPFTVNAAPQLKRGKGFLLLDLFSPGRVSPRPAGNTDLNSGPGWKVRVLAAIPVGMLLAIAPCVAVPRRRIRAGSGQPIVRSAR